MKTMRVVTLACVGVLLICGLIGQVNATPLTVTSPFLQLLNVSTNSVGAPPGQRIRFGANDVVPNGDAGTTGLATTTYTGQACLDCPVQVPINFSPDPVAPNFFVRNIPFDSGLLEPWTLTFTNGGDTSLTTLDLHGATAPPAFVTSITLSGTSTNPTFTWTPPLNTTVNGYRINIYDKSQNNALVVNKNQTATSYTVQAADFTVPGYEFTLGTNYSIEISLLQTRDSSSTNLANDNVYGLSRVYADFTPLANGSPVVNLPVVNLDGAYKYNIAIEANTIYYLDPEVAVGYDFAIGVGNPNFQSVVLPTGIGDNLYDIFGFDTQNNPILLINDLLGGVPFDFGSSGRDRFRVLGIETSAGLDPANTTAFITGVTFTGSGLFTGTQTPITAQVPEPSALTLFGFGLAWLGLRRRSTARGLRRRSPA